MGYIQYGQAILFGQFEAAKTKWSYPSDGRKYDIYTCINSISLADVHKQPGFPSLLSARSYPTLAWYSQLLGISVTTNYRHYSVQSPNHSLMYKRNVLQHINVLCLNLPVTKLMALLTLANWPMVMIVRDQYLDPNASLKSNVSLEETFSPYGY